MASDPVIAALLSMAERATTPQERLSCLMEAAIRPGLITFLKAEVLKHGGAKTTELPDIYMGVFGNLAAELIENYMANTGEHAGARKALRKFLKERFDYHLDRAVKSRFSQPGAPLVRHDS